MITREQLNYVLNDEWTDATIKYWTIYFLHCVPYRDIVQEYRINEEALNMFIRIFCKGIQSSIYSQSLSEQELLYYIKEVLINSAPEK